MLKNYLKIACRNIKRKPIFSIINITGLAIGLAACVLIGLWVQQQLSYDRFNKKSGRIYRLVYHMSYPGGEATMNVLPVPLADVLNNKYPTVKKAIRVFHAPIKVVKTNNQLFDQKGYVIADPGFFNMFTFPLLQGNPAHLLQRPGSMVLTKSMAQKYFPDKKALGQSLKVDGQLKTVTGVVADPPPNSSLQFAMVETSLGNKQSSYKRWGQNSVSIYALLHSPNHIQQLQSSITKVVSSHKHINNRSGFSASIYLQPLTAIHMGRSIPYHVKTYPKNAARASGNAAYVWLFIALALFILGLASINYINLATAQGTDRAREVGIRKTLGADRWGVARQFVGEAALTCLSSSLLALVIVQLTLPVFNKAIGARLSLAQLGGWIPITILISLIIALIVLSSWYPALLLSRFSPRSVFQSEKRGGQSQQLRKILVVFQFSVAVILIIATLIVYRQLHYMRSTSLGFDQDQVVVLKNLNKIETSAGQGNREAANVKQRYHLIKNQLRQLSDVTDASLTFSVPSELSISTIWHGVGANRTKKNQIHYTFVDANYLPTLGITPVAGRNFSDQRNDSASVILNKAAVKIFFGSAQKALGKQILWLNRDLNVVGVVKNFHFYSLRQQITPMALIYNNGNYRVREMAVRLNAGHIQQAFTRLKQTWQKLVPNIPFNYSFLNQQVAAQYKTQQQTGRIFAGFTILAIVVACLGLFGLTTYATQRRTKEIGIRKVLGASVVSIVGLLSKDFLKLVAVGFVIAVPIGWYAMHRWLQNFAYKIHLRPWIFLLVGGLTLVIALATVSWQSIRAALANPVDSLRSE